MRPYSSIACFTIASAPAHVAAVPSLATARPPSADLFDDARRVGHLIGTTGADPEIIDHDLCSGPRQLQRVFPADAAPATRDDGDAPFETARVLPLHLLRW